MMFQQVIITEALKLKRTLAFRLAWAAPVVVVFINFIVILRQGSSLIGPDENPWIRLFQQNLVIWALLMLPLFVTLETALLAQLEHSGNHWKHLFVLPVSRAAIYAVKLASALFLIALSFAALGGFSLLAGWTLRLLRPGYGFHMPVPLGRFLAYLGFVYIGTWLIISFHSWIAMRWKSFVTAVGTGIVMSVAGILIMYSDWRIYYPWTLPGVLANGFSRGVLSFPEVLIGGLGGLLLGVIGGWDVLRRDFQ